MRGKDFDAGLKGGLFDAQHYKRMGAALWLYGWLILRQTRQEGTLGFVLGGKPVTYREIEEETGFGRKTLERWMKVLRQNGYIEARVVATGIVVKITKAKKFSRRFGSNRTQAESSLDPRTSNMRTPGLGVWDTSPQICGATQVNSADHQRLAGRICSRFIDGRNSKHTACLEASQLFHTKSSEDEESGTRDALHQRSEIREWEERAQDRGSGRRWPYTRSEPSSARQEWRSPGSDWRMLREELIRRELRVGTGPEVRHRQEPAGDPAAEIAAAAEPGMALKTEPSAPPLHSAQGNLFDSAETQAQPQKSLRAVEGGSKTAGAA